MTYHIDTERVSLDDLRKRIEETDLVSSRASLLDETSARMKVVDILQSSETTIGPDSLRVKEKGHELDPQVGIGNRRSGSVPRAGTYFVAMREATPRDLIGQLRALTE
jgi:hypothetical protein